MPAKTSRFSNLQLTFVFVILLSLVTSCRLVPAETWEPLPPVITDPPPASAYQTREALLAANAPERDPLDLAARLRGEADIPRTVAEPLTFTRGDVLPFWYSNHATNENERIQARLVYQSADLNLWVEEGESVRQQQVQDAAAVLEQHIIPTNRVLFGEEWRPGVDRDRRLNILHVRDLGGNVVGYFATADEYVSAVNPYSNERELLYVSLKYAPIGSDEYYEVIAHEMQHLIHWQADANESSWIDEGLAVLAARLNGYESTDFAGGFAASPDVPLTHFDYEGEQVLAHYGSAYLFALYFLEQFGEAGVRVLVNQPANGVQGVMAALEELQADQTFDELFTDWTIASFLDGRDRGTGLYQFGRVALPPVTLTGSHNRFPVRNQASVNQYGADYISVQHSQPVTLVFTGTQQVRLLNTTPRSGDYFWTTIPADDSDMTLTRRFDLTGVETATLTFWSWYHLEEGWDYAYVMASTDEGATWELLETEHTTRRNPHGNSFGPALTGISGPDEVPRWIRQEVNLTRYTGQPILIRFEYVTDDAVLRPGLALDDIAIPELDFLDDAEGGAGDWTAAGFVRHTNILPHSFLVHQILIGEETVLVERLALDENQQGRWIVPLSRDFNEAILVISGSTPVTAVRASYSYEIQQ